MEKKSIFEILILILIAIIIVGVVLYNKSNSTSEAAEVKTEQNEDRVYIKVNERGEINSVVDGVDITTVNIWSTNKKDRGIVTTCLNKEPVKVLFSDGTYFKIRTEDGKESWVMREYVDVKY